MFTARLKNLLNYYVKSRQVNDDYERLLDLLISDKLKESLPPGPLQFVLSKKGAECFKSSMIADLPDIHANNKIGMPSYSKQSYGSTVSDKKNSLSQTVTLSRTPSPLSVTYFMDGSILIRPQTHIHTSK